MNTLKIIRQLCEYNLWANTEFLQYFKKTTKPEAKALRIFAHLLLAEKTWLQRIINENSDNTGADFWRGKSLEECARLFEENQSAFSTFLSDLTEEKLDEVFAYKNSKGMTFRNIVREALTHAFLHSSYHRGQAAQAIRLNGDTPPYTDFIQFLRK